MNNPYAPPTRPDTSGLSRRRLLYGLIFGVLALGTVVGIQWYRFQRIREEMVRAVQQAQAAEMRAKKAEMQARQAAEENRRAEAIDEKAIDEQLPD